MPSYLPHTHPVVDAKQVFQFRCYDHWSKVDLSLNSSETYTRSSIGICNPLPTPLLPCLFSLFCDSLSDEIKSLGKGVPFGNEKLSILPYADDVVLLAETEADLQIMLNVLYKWCIFT